LNEEKQRAVAYPNRPHLDRPWDFLEAEPGHHGKPVAKRAQIGKYRPVGT